MNTQEKGLEFERKVAELYRLLGARRVVHNTIIEGSQVDIFVESELSDGTPVRTIVECKSYSRPVGAEAVGAFSVVFKNLHYSGKADKGILVSQSGFTAQAKVMASAAGLELYEIVELEHKLKAAPKKPELTTKVEEPRSDKKYVFVLMPFAEEFYNIFWFGIRGAIEDAGLYCERADDIQYTGNVLDMINDHIQKADAIVAEMTCRNPNVFYEVGIAHTLQKPTVLIVQEAEDIPFDLRTQNHLVYKAKNIKYLRERLAKLLRTITS